MGIKTATEGQRTRAADRFAFLAVLERRGNVYAGTVPAKVKARRRAANRVAAASRRANRGVR